MAVAIRPGPKPPNDALTAVARKNVMNGDLSARMKASGSRITRSKIGTPIATPYVIHSLRTALFASLAAIAQHSLLRSGQLTSTTSTLERCPISAIGALRYHPAHDLDSVEYHIDNRPQF